MIIKEVSVVLTQEEIDSPDPIEIKLNVSLGEDPEDSVTYTINYPKS